jgi:hypothetical protein
MEKWFDPKKVGNKKRASYLYRTAQPLTLARFPCKFSRIVI